MRTGRNGVRPAPRAEEAEFEFSPGEAEAFAPEMDLPDFEEGPDLPTVARLTFQEVKEASEFGREQAMAVVGLYYSIQKIRVGSDQKIQAHERGVDILADSALIKYLKTNLGVLEKQVARQLKKFAESSVLGRWALSQLGCGPVIVAGLLAHIDVVRAQTAGAIWRFAGLDPTAKWTRERGLKRPYNQHLKVLCWKLGQSFKKVSGNPDSLYGRLYRERKLREVRWNEEGRFAVQAAAILAERKGRRVSPEQKEIWSSGKLQKMGLDLRAARYAVKVFLSHYHQVGREALGLPLVKPWVFEHCKDADGNKVEHVHYIEIPNWPMQDE